MCLQPPGGGETAKETKHSRFFNLRNTGYRRRADGNTTTGELPTRRTNGTTGNRGEKKMNPKVGR